MTSSYSAFPAYTDRERQVDAAIHLLGLLAAPFAIFWFFGRAAPELTPGRILTGAIYCFGLIGMLSASALYNMAPHGPGKALFRRLDHAMIFVMIAGTYTPLSITALSPYLGVPLCIAIWTMAAVGIGLTLVRPAHRHERLALALYLGMGWMVLPLVPALIRALPGATMLLILAGGLLYSFGAFIHTRRGLPFHNPLWHAMVLAAAALHLVALEQVIALPA
jgi:hemolysin III